MIPTDQLGDPPQYRPQLRHVTHFMSDSQFRVASLSRRFVLTHFNWLLDRRAVRLDWQFAYIRWNTTGRCRRRSMHLCLNTCPMSLATRFPKTVIDRSHMLGAKRPAIYSVGVNGVDDAGQAGLLVNGRYQHSVPIAGLTSSTRSIRPC